MCAAFYVRGTRCVFEFGRFDYIQIDGRGSFNIQWINVTGWKCEARRKRAVYIVKLLVE